MTLPKKQKNEDKLIAEANNLADLVEYQQGAVVSRTIVEGKGGTVTLFAFDGGQGLSEHSAPFDALVCIIDGKVKVTISGEPSELTAGQMIIMPANKPHALQSIGRFKMMLVMIKS